MTRITLPASIGDAPTAAQPLLKAVEGQLGMVPNLFRLIGNSPAALEGYLGLSGALGKGRLSLARREAIALAVAEANGCGYCLAAHTYVGREMARLSTREISANRGGESSDEATQAALRFALDLISHRGRVSAAAVSGLRSHGFGEDEVVEIVAAVAMNLMTNFLNNALATPIDFPEVEALRETA